MLLRQPPPLHLKYVLPRMPRLQVSLEQMKRIRRLVPSGRVKRIGSPNGTYLCAKLSLAYLAGESTEQAKQKDLTKFLKFWMEVGHEQVDNWTPAVSKQFQRSLWLSTPGACIA